MGAGASTPFENEEEALAAGTTQEEIDAWKHTHALKPVDTPAPTDAPAPTDTMVVFDKNEMQLINYDTSKPIE